MHVVEVEELARRLAAAQDGVAPIPPISASRPDLGIGDAYAVQAAGLALRLAGGERVVGHKIGLTSRAMQAMVGVEQPDYGYLLAGAVHATGATVPARNFVAPRVEGEIAFRLAATVSGPAVSARDVLAATEAVAPALEIIDSRIADWKITIVDTIADNASCGAAVIGRWVPSGALGVDLAAVPMRMTVAGEVVEGRGDAVLGDPAESVAWLARALHAHGEALHAGEVVLSGALGRALPFRAGDVAEAAFGALGDVRAAF